MKFKTSTGGFIFTSGGTGVNEAFSIEILSKEIKLFLTEPTVPSEIYVKIKENGLEFDFFIYEKGILTEITPVLQKGKSYTFQPYPGHNFYTVPEGEDATPVYLSFKLTSDSVDYTLTASDSSFTIVIPDTATIAYSDQNDSNSGSLNTAPDGLVLSVPELILTDDQEHRITISYDKTVGSFGCLLYTSDAADE